MILTYEFCSSGPFLLRTKFLIRSIAKVQYLVGVCKVDRELPAEGHLCRA